MSRFLLAATLVAVLVSISTGATAQITSIFNGSVIANGGNGGTPRATGPSGGSALFTCPGPTPTQLDGLVPNEVWATSNRIRVSL